MHFVYIVQCRDGSLYTGYTTDLNKRLAKHNQGRGAKYTRSRLPVTLVYAEQYATKEEALSWEKRIQQLTRQQKLRMISHPATEAESLDQGRQQSNREEE